MNKIALFEKKIIETSKSELFDDAIKEWVMIFKQFKVIDCICGDKVKHSAIIYNKLTRTCLEIGGNCCKKYDIHIHCSNDILVHICKIAISQNNIDQEKYISFESSIQQYIEDEYKNIFTKRDNINDYYTVIPLYHLLNNVIDLKDNYGFSLDSYYLEIKQDIELIELNNKENEEIESEYSTSKSNSISTDYDNCSEISLLSLDESENDCEAVVECERVCEPLREPVCESKLEYVTKPEHIVINDTCDLPEYEEQTLQIITNKVDYEGVNVGSCKTMYYMNKHLKRLKKLRENVNDIRKLVVEFTNRVTKLSETLQK